MPALHIYSEARFIGRFTLFEETIWIGRSRENHLILPEASIARRQALLYKHRQQFILEDRGANGLQVNGQITPQETLQHEDLIQMGPYRLVFDALCEVSPEWQLVVLSGDDSGKAIVLKVGVTQIGRSEKNDLTLNDASVSAFHAEIHLTNDAMILRDLGSTNGTWIHGERQDEIVLSINTEFQVGQTRLALCDHLATALGLGHRIREFAEQDVPLLICGEVGVGKRRAAREVHRFSPHRHAPMIHFDCRDTPPEKMASALLGHEKGAQYWALSQHQGAFERAGQGTLFLQDFDALDHPAQVALLQTLEQRTFTRCGGTDAQPAPFRLIAATCLPQDSDALRHAVLPELYTHLSGCTLSLLPLRERREEILPLATHFLAGTPMAKAAEDPLMAHLWPGNIGELQNVIERAVIVTNKATSDATRIETEDILFHSPR